MWDGEILQIVMASNHGEPVLEPNAPEQTLRFPILHRFRYTRSIEAPLGRPMEVLSSREEAVLDAIALQVPEVADALAGQQGKVRVTARENT
jgi:hypothetical protein